MHTQGSQNLTTHQAVLYSQCSGNETIIELWACHGIEEVYRVQQGKLEDFYEAFPPGVTELKKVPISKCSHQVEEADI